MSHCPAAERTAHNRLVVGPRTRAAGCNSNLSRRTKGILGLDGKWKSGNHLVFGGGVLMILEAPQSRQFVPQLLYLCDKKKSELIYPF